MSQQGLQGFARILLLVGGVVVLLGGLLGLVGGFVSASPVLALVVGIVALVHYGRLGSEGSVVLLVLDLLLPVIAGGLASIGGILVSIMALVFTSGSIRKGLV